MTVISSGTWPIDATTTSGTELAAYLNELVNAIQTTQASPTRPPAIQKGGLWTKTLGATDIALMLYDGTTDIEIGRVVGGNANFGGTAVSTTAPTPATAGMLWVDNSLAGVPVLKVYTGTLWEIPTSRNNPNILINGGMKVNQRGVTIAAAAVGKYGPDRWKRTAGGMTQIIEPVNYVPTTTYTLSGSGVTTAQLTSPATGYWTLPDIPITATNIKLEQGSVATPFEHRSYGEELLLCQRYYQTMEQTRSYFHTTLAGEGVIATIRLPVPMRGHPAVGYVELAKANTASVVFQNVTSQSFNYYHRATGVGYGDYTWSNTLDAEV